MSKIIINGKSYSGKNITVTDNTVIVDGKVVDDTPQKIVEVKVEGDVESLTSHVSVTLNGDVDNVEAGNSVTVHGDVFGSIDAGNSVHCGDVYGYVKAGNSIYKR